MNLTLNCFSLSLKLKKNSPFAHEVGDCLDEAL
jgi:hypothetical protein